MKDSKENIKNEAPILFGLKKKEVLKIPNNYFEELPIFLKQIPLDRQVKVIYFRKRFAKSIAVAALFVIGFFGMQQYYYQQEITSFKNSFNELTVAQFEDEFIEDYSLNQEIDFNDDQKLNYYLNELDKPTKSLEIFNDDLDHLFEYDSNFY